LYDKEEFVETYEESSLSTALSVKKLRTESSRKENLLDKNLETNFESENSYKLRTKVLSR